MTLMCAGEPTLSPNSPSLSRGARFAGENSRDGPVAAGYQSGHGAKRRRSDEMRAVDRRIPAQRSVHRTDSLTTRRQLGAAFYRAGGDVASPRGQLSRVRDCELPHVW